VIVSGVVQGVGTGLIFVPLSTIAFATLDPKFRGEAAAVYTLLRSLGSSAGISILEYVFTRNVEVVRSGLAPHLRTDNPNAQAYLPSAMNLHSQAGLAVANAELNRQAAMVAYVDDFHLMLIMSFAILPLYLLMSGKRRPKPAGGGDAALEAQGAH
jgi:DHA2 family multidrug resistance protein